MATAIDDITQSISTIPPLRLTETVINLPSDEDDFVAKYEANNAHLVNNLVPELNTLKTQINNTTGQINTVASEVTTAEASVSAHYTAIEAVASNATNINAVNANSININAVASNSTNINAVNANKTNIDAVALNEINIDAVANNETNINNVSTNMPKITNVSTNMGDISLVADAINSGTLPTIINDSTASTASTWSSDKIDDAISTAVGNIDLSSKQDTLVSGTNIKTVNSISILGSGDIPINPDPYSVGDIVISKDATKYISPIWLLADGSLVDSFVYPELSVMLDYPPANNKLTNPATLPTGAGYGVAWSADGTYMSVALNTSPYITIYKRSGDGKQLPLVVQAITEPAYIKTGITL